jgi:hypothetical protein
MSDKQRKCKIALNIEVDGKKFKVVDLKDPCAAINRVLARHEGLTIITPKEYENLVNKKKGVLTSN